MANVSQGYTDDRDEHAQEERRTVSTTLSVKRQMVRFGAIVVCPKCGGEDLYRGYHENTHVPGCDLFATSPECCELEHHCRTCRGCGYKWVEEVSDAD